MSNALFSLARYAANAFPTVGDKLNFSIKRARDFGGEIRYGVGTKTNDFYKIAQTIMREVYKTFVFPDKIPIVVFSKEFQKGEAVFLKTPHRELSDFCCYVLDAAKCGLEGNVEIGVNGIGEIDVKHSDIVRDFGAIEMVVNDAQTLSYFVSNIARIIKECNPAHPIPVDDLEVGDLVCTRVPRKYGRAHFCFQQPDDLLAEIVTPEKKGEKYTFVSVKTGQKQNVEKYVPALMPVIKRAGEWTKEDLKNIRYSDDPTIDNLINEAAEKAINTEGLRDLLANIGEQLQVIGTIKARTSGSPIDLVRTILNYGLDRGVAALAYHTRMDDIREKLLAKPIAAVRGYYDSIRNFSLELVQRFSQEAGINASQLFGEINEFHLKLLTGYEAKFKKLKQKAREAFLYDINIGLHKQSDGQGYDFYTGERERAYNPFFSFRHRHEPEEDENPQEMSELREAGIIIKRYLDFCRYLETNNGLEMSLKTPRLLVTMKDPETGNQDFVGSIYHLKKRGDIDRLNYITQNFMKTTRGGVEYKAEDGSLHFYNDTTEELCVVSLEAVVTLNDSSKVFRGDLNVDIELRGENFTLVDITKDEYQIETKDELDGLLEYLYLCGKYTPNKVSRKRAREIYDELSGKYKFEDPMLIVARDILGTLLEIGDSIDEIRRYTATALPGIRGVTEVIGEYEKNLEAQREATNSESVNNSCLRSSNMIPRFALQSMEGVRSVIDRHSWDEGDGANLDYDENSKLRVALGFSAEDDMHEDDDELLPIDDARQTAYWRIALVNTVHKYLGRDEFHRGKPNVDRITRMLVSQPLREATFEVLIPELSRGSLPQVINVAGLLPIVKTEYK